MPATLKPRKKPLQARSTATVDDIVEATIRILRRDGWAACTTTRISTLAGVSVGSLYQYFPNRNAIAVEIVRQRTRTYLTAVMAADLSRATSAEEAVDAAIAAAFSVSQSTSAIRQRPPARQRSTGTGRQWPEMLGKQTLGLGRNRRQRDVHRALAGTAADIGREHPLQGTIGLRVVGRH